MAAPFVSGLAGLMRSASPSLTNSQIKQAILNKVDVLPGLQKKVLTGGRINAYGAVSTVVNNQVPSVSLSGAPDNGHGPLLVSFTANAQDSDGYIVSYRWDFEADGVYDTTTTSNVINHTYDGPGVYTIKVMVKDNNGAAPVSTATITVLPPNNPPVIGLLTASVESGYAPLYVEFSASGYDNDGSVVKYEWDVDGDGIYDINGDKVSYTYTNAGIYNVYTSGEYKWGFGNRRR